MSDILDTLDNLEEALNSGLPMSELTKLWDKERDKKNRKGALEAIGDSILEAVEAQKDEITALKSTIRDLEDAATDAPREAPLPVPKVQAPAAHAEAKTLSTLFNSDSVFVIAPLHAVQQWAGLSQITKYVVDVTGEHSEMLCRQYPHPYTELADGTYRIATPNVRVARVIENKMKNAAKVRDITVGIKVHSLGSSASLATDMVRGRKVALWREMCVVSAQRLRVSTLSKSGSGVTGIELNW
jgi:hypothetical protein